LNKDAKLLNIKKIRDLFLIEENSKLKKLEDDMRTDKIKSEFFDIVIRYFKKLEVIKVKKIGKKKIKFEEFEFSSIEKLQTGSLHFSFV